MNKRNPMYAGVKRHDMKDFIKKRRRIIIIISGIIIALIFILNGVYSLNNGEEAVITRFGRHIGTEKTAGLKFKIPFVDRAYIVNVAGVRRMDFGSQLINGIYVDIP